VYTSRSGLFIAKSDGSEVRKLVSFPGRVYDPLISPDGTRIRVRVEDQTTGEGEPIGRSGLVSTFSRIV
jgi:hypothetical protein